LPETLLLVPLPERCRECLIVPGNRREGGIGNTLRQQGWGCAQETVPPLNMVVQTEKGGVRCQRIQCQTEAAQFYAGRVDIDPIQAVTCDIIEGLPHDLRGRRLMTGTRHRQPLGKTLGSGPEKCPAPTHRIAYF